MILHNAGALFMTSDQTMFGSNGSSTEPAPIRDKYAVFVDWLMHDSEQKADVDADSLVQWMTPHFQNYYDGAAFNINKNGRALRQLAQLLSQRKTAKAPAKARGPTRTILLVADYAPSKGHAGGLRLLDMYVELRRIEPNLKIDLYAPSQPAVDGNLDYLSDIFDNVYLTSAESFSLGDFLMRAGAHSDYDLVDAQFHRAGRMLGAFRSISRYQIFTPMESEARSAYDRMRKALKESGSLSLSAVFHTLHTTLDELLIMANADETICVSSADSCFLDSISGPLRVGHVPTGLSPVEFSAELSSYYKQRPPSARPRQLVFAAYYGSDTNIAGLRWYLDHVHSRVVDAVPEYRFLVVGRGDLAWLHAENRPNVVIVGEVPQLSPVFNESRGGLVLALHGSGFRGKINQYAICGIPSITTPLGLTGLDYTPGKNILAAEDPAEFAVECIRVLKDDAYADNVGACARDFALKHYCWGSMHQRLREIYGV